VADLLNRKKANVEFDYFFSRGKEATAGFVLFFPPTSN